MRARVFRLTAIALLWSCSTSGAAQGLVIHVENVSVRSEQINDPAVVMLRFKFRLRLQNEGTQEVKIGSAPIFVMTIQNRLPDRSWNTLAEQSWYDDASQKYAPCSELNAGQSVGFGDVDTGIALLRKQLNVVGSDPVLRFRLQLRCQQSDGSKVNVGIFVTEPFKASLKP